MSHRLAALSATLLLLVASSCSSGEADVTATPGLTRPATTATTPRPALTPVTTPPAVDLTDPPPDVFTSDGLEQLTEAFEIELGLLVARDAPGLRDRMSARCRERVTVEHVERDVEFLGYGLPALWRSELSELVPTHQNGSNVSFSFTLVHQDDPSIVVSKSASDLPGQMRWEAGAWRTDCMRFYPGTRVPPAAGLPEWASAVPVSDPDDPAPDLSQPEGLQTLLDQFRRGIDLLSAGDAVALFELNSVRCSDVVTMELIERGIAQFEASAANGVEIELGELLLLEQRGNQVLFAISIVYGQDPSTEIIPLDVHFPTRRVWENGAWRIDDCEPS